jgi:hypothetical protein
VAIILARHARTTANSSKHVIDAGTPIRFDDRPPCELALVRQPTLTVTWLDVADSTGEGQAGRYAEFSR